jgi:hypothetical protein
MWRNGDVHSDRRRGIRKPNAQQSLLEGAAMARRAERRRRLARLAQQGDGQSSAGDADGDGDGVQGGGTVAWVGCQWLMEGYCGRAEERTVPRSPAAPQAQGGDSDGGSPSEQGASNDTDPPQRPNRAA